MRTWVFQFIDLIGRWAMLDVFVVAGAGIGGQTERAGDGDAGQGTAGVGGVVVFTILASESFLIRS